MVDRYTKEADDLTQQLIKANWRPSRAHIEGARNSLRHASSRITALEAERDRLKAELAEKDRVMAECYQAVGMLGEILDLSGQPDFVRLQDMLAYGKTEDGKELLPFPLLRNERAETATRQLEEQRVRTLGVIGPFANIVARDSPCKDDDPIFQDSEDLLAGHFRAARALATELEASNNEQA